MAMELLEGRTLQRVLHDDGPLPRVHRVHDRFFDWFYMWK
jgi:hypothetical protein